ncbi:MAG: Uma2 family endonuclease [Gemmatirosa sp.]|nr:Uma2 family endonuclease [Gemmatirosa sp.]
MADPEAIEIASEPVYYTADMVRDLIREDRAWPRYECIYGELVVTPAPVGPHQFIVTRLLVCLSTYVEGWQSELVALVSPADISWGRDDVTVQPDVFVIPRDMGRASWHAHSWDPIRHLALAIEVISPSSRRDDRFRKRTLYQDRGVPLYWIVDPETQVAEVWTPDVHFPTIERERLVWHPEGAPEPLTIELAALFAQP